MRSCQCGGNKFSVLLGFVGSGGFKENGDFEVSTIDTLDDTVESIECERCGQVYERPCGRDFEEYSFPPVIVSIRGGVADVVSNPTFGNVVVRDYDCEGLDYQRISQDENGSDMVEEVY